MKNLQIGEAVRCGPTRPPRIKSVAEQRHILYTTPTSTAGFVSMAQSVLGKSSQDGLFKFEEFIRNRSRYSNLVDPSAFPLNDQHRQSIANIIEGIDRVSVQGILVRAIASHLHEEFGKHVATICDTFWGPSRNSYAFWVEAGADGQRDRMLDNIRYSLEMATPTVTRDLLLEGVLAYSDVSQACLAAANTLSSGLWAALDEIEATYQTCSKMLQETRNIDKCKCSAEASTNHLENEEFLEFCCEISREISARKEALHITFSTFSKAVEQAPEWETRRDTLRSLDKLYWEYKSRNICRQKGRDDVKEHLIDVMGGIAESMPPSERERYFEEGFNFRVLEVFEAKLYEELKNRKRKAEKKKPGLPKSTKDDTTTHDNRKLNPRTETADAGKKHMSEEARVQKAETKRLKRRRAKDRKALQKALANLDLGDIN